MKGVLVLFYEQGMECIGVPIFQDSRYIKGNPDKVNARFDFKGLHTIDSGDYLIILDKKGENILWKGRIRYTKLENMRGPDLKKYLKSGRVNFPVGFRWNSWLKYFEDTKPYYKAILKKKMRPKNENKN